MAEINKLVVPISDGHGGYTPTEITFEGSGGGSGLPDEVITYEQFLSKTDADQAAYTGYVTDWPGSGGGGEDTTMRYNEETDWIQVKVNGAWVNCYYAGMKLDPTKMELTQDEFVAICNQGLQSRMSVGAIIHVNNTYCNTLEVIDVEHEDVLNSVDVMAHTQVGKSIFANNSQDYNVSTIRTWINSDYINTFDYEIRELMKTMQVITNGATQNDKVKILSWKELGIVDTAGLDVTDGGVQYPVFTAGTGSTAIVNRWRGQGTYGDTDKYWIRSRAATTSKSVWYVTINGTCSTGGCSTSYGVLPVMRF